MAFPIDNLGAVVQMKINNTWTNVTRYDTQTKILDTPGINISRGQGGLQDKTPAGNCAWTWDDPNGIYNNENPRSPYFGILPRNTPVRVYVPRSEAALFIVDRDDGGRGQTTDKAVLDVTGDLELRMDIEPRRFTRWGSGANRVQILCSKFGSSGNRSWYLRLRDPSLNYGGALSFVYSTTGSNSVTSDSTVALPLTGRISIKVTMDVDNGAGGHDVKFYTSTTGINGTYTQLGATVTTAGTTATFSSSANVELGTFNGGMLDATAALGVFNYRGRIYGFQMYNGIGGTKVAEADYTGRANGTTSFSDGLATPNTWTLGGSAEITNADYRFHGEYSAPVIKPKRTNAGTGVDVKIEAEAGGLIRRFAAPSNPPLKSPITLAFPSFSPNGWWSGEDSTGADDSRASSNVTNGKSAGMTNISFVGYDSTLAGSAGVMECAAGASFVGACNTATPTAEAHFIGYFKMPSIPTAGNEPVIFKWYSNTGTARIWTWSVGDTYYSMNAYNSVGTLISNSPTLFGGGANPTDWIAVHCQLTQNGGNVDLKMEWMSITTGAAWTGSPASYAGTVGSFSSVSVKDNSSGLSGTRMAHMMTSSLVGLGFYDGVQNTFARFSAGFAGETGDARFKRIGALLGINTVVVGEIGNSEPMGPQPIDTGLNILYEIPAVDGGVILESADQLALEYRTRMSLYNQAGLALTWAQLSEGLQATPDDTDTANDITLSRANGGSARAVQEYGPMSIQAPPNGINTVPDDPTINNYLDLDLQFLVGFRLSKGTWPTSRYPEVSVDMERTPFTGSASLKLDATKTDISDMVAISAMPLFMAPETLYLLVKGTKEEISGRHWGIKWATVPYGPYIGSELFTVGTYSNFRAAQTTLLGVDQQQLNADIDDSVTSIAVKTLTGPLFLVGASGFNIKIGAEVMTVTNIVGGTSPQTLTVTRGVNGYSSSHSANDYVYLEPTLRARL